MKVLIPARHHHQVAILDDEARTMGKEAKIKWNNNLIQKLIVLLGVKRIKVATLIKVVGQLLTGASCSGHRQEEEHFERGGHCSIFVYSKN